MHASTNEPRAVARSSSGQAASEIAEAVGGELELERVLELIAKRGRSLVEARSVVIMLRDAKDLVVEASAGDVPDGLRGARVPIQGSLAGQVLSTGTAERFPDLSATQRFSLAQLGVHASAALDVPLIFRGQRLGVLAAFDRLRGHPAFGPEDEILLRGFAASAATAVHTAKSASEARLRHSLEAAEQERRRWARELHDETLQGLGALRVLLASGLKQDSPAARETAMLEATAQIGHEIESLRALITELRPAALDELGLQPAIESLLERTADIQGLNVEARLQLDSVAKRLSEELESAVYRVVQEALTNIAKHARAEHVWLTLTRTDEGVSMLIRDDGLGFDPTGPRSGFGLAGMRERVELAGGTLSLSSAPGEGTTIEATIPTP